MHVHLYSCPPSDIGPIAPVEVKWNLKKKKKGLIYGGDIEWSDHMIISYSDSDFASNLNDRRSVTGNIHLLGGVAISWVSKHQMITATSTCEAEYITASTCTRHITWLQNLLSGLGYTKLVHCHFL